MATRSMTNRIEDLESSVGSIEKNMQTMMEQMERILKNQEEAASKGTPSISDSEDVSGSSGKGKDKGEGVILLVFWQVERYFSLNRLSQEEKIDVSFIAFEGDALKWFQWENKRHPITRWEDLKYLLFRQFRSLATGSLCEQFLAVKQEGSIDDYRRKFVELAAPLDGIPEEIFLGQYINGLENTIKAELRLLNPLTLSEAMEMSSKVEVKNKMMVREKPSYSGKKSSSVNMDSESSLSSSMSSSSASNKTGSEFRKLSDQEVQQRRALGLCYRCDEKYAPGHKCSKKEINVLLIQEEEENVAVKDEEEKSFNSVDVVDIGQKVEVHLNSVVGLSNPKTMKLEGVIGEQKFHLEGCLEFGACGVDQVSELHEGDSIEALLKEYDNVFNMPPGLPSIRGREHGIVFKDGMEPINVRPYRYPHYQKDEIEKLVKEMLDAGVIQPSANKFPITVIDELLDELNGARVFSKLDLKSGYHQIRMIDHDVQKTAFITHQGHYEFLVLPFGLVNAPATFQNLMNDVFQSFLRKFVLVFFDDILVYSKSLDEHKNHLRMVFEVLSRNRLYANRKKCEFNRYRLGYLGHVISSEGVEVDDTKEEQPIAYFSQALGLRAKKKSVYEKELMTIVFAVRKWRPYLLGQHFVVRSDQQSLRFLLEQRELEADSSCHRGFDLQQGLLLYRNSLVIPRTSKFIPLIFDEFHGSPIGGHCGEDRTYQRIASEVFWVMEQIGKVAYRLDLPDSSRIHPVFHVSQLRQAIGNCASSKDIPTQLTEDLELRSIPEDILDIRPIVNGDPGQLEVLVKWKGLSEFESSWELLEMLLQQFPDCHLENKMRLLEGSIGKPQVRFTYRRKGK
ncbi:hypothetical protein L6452_21935 [Arctium lappa]|uniref:Uncharacterized protein n=1 Tax=Arctium lappa TaxID=4217 RepID=A0ACB9AYN8_ARCLA|nr:hypothetical protein L6452_21935 [Arctium lappa]